MNTIKKWLRWLASMRVGLALLGTTAVFLALGTLLVPEHYSESLLFKILLGLLLLNSSICTANQLRIFWNRLVKKRAGLRALGVFLLHLGIVVTLVGGILGGFYGHKAKFALFEGDSLNLTEVSEGRLPYTLFLDRFEISLYEDGTASQFGASFRLVGDDGAVLSGSASVNQPFDANGTKLYYAEYMNGLRVQTATTHQFTGEEMLGHGESVPLPATTKRVQIVQYCPDYHPANWSTNPSLIPKNEAVVYHVFEGEGEPELMAAPLGEWVRVDDDSYMKFSEMRYYVVFLIKSDPGLILTTCGGVLLMLGACLYVMNRRNGHGNSDPTERAADAALVSGGDDLLSDRQES